MRRLTVLALAALFFGAPLSAQLRADPGATVNGKVVVTIQATLFDLDTPYAPLSQYELVFHGQMRDSTIVRTNDAGVASVGLAPGQYRLVSRSSYPWKGALYQWSMPVTVRGGMALIDLSPRNAAVTGGPSVAASEQSRAAAAAARDAEPHGTRSRLRAPKSPTLGFVLSFALLPGAGQFYAERPGQGTVVLLTAVGGAIYGASAGSCGISVSDSECTSIRRRGTLGAAVAFGAWAYSFVAAPVQVKQWNRRHTQFGARGAPVLHVATRGPATDIGLAVRW